MVALNTLLLVGLISFGVGVVITGMVVALVVIYNKVKEEDSDSDNEGFAIPLSSLMGGGLPAGLSVADVQKATAAMRAAQGGAPPTPTADVPTGGTYL